MLKTRLKNTQTAQGLVEFALVLPLLLLLILGIFAFGHLFFSYTSVVSASREAARWGAAVGGDGISTRYQDCPSIRAQAVRVGGFAGVVDTNIPDPAEDPTAPKTDGIYIGFDHGPQDAATFDDCSDDAGPVDVTMGDRIVVLVRVNYTPIVPIVNIPSFPLEATTYRTILRSVPVGDAPTAVDPCTVITYIGPDKDHPHSIFADPSPYEVGKPVTFTVPVGAEDGAIQEGNITLSEESLPYTCTGTLVNGQYVCPPPAGVTFCTAGDKTLKVSFDSTQMCYPSITEDIITHPVAKATPEIKIVPFPLSPVAKTPFTTKISILPAGTCTTPPTGTVTFTMHRLGQTDNFTWTDQPLQSDGTFTLSSYILENPGTYELTASYSGDADYNPNTATIQITVAINDPCATKVIKLTQGADASVVGQPVIYQASVFGTDNTPLDGTVKITDTDSSTADCSLSLSSGLVTCPAVTYMNAGTQTVTVTHNNTCQETYQHVVNRAGTSIQLTYAPQPAAISSPVTVTARVLPTAPGGGTPVGTVTMTYPGLPACTASLSNGVASCTFTPPTAGAVTVSASYPGTSNYLPSSNSLTFTVINNKCPFISPETYNLFQVQSAIQFPIYNPAVAGASSTYVTSVNLNWPTTPLALAQELRFDADPGAGGLGSGCVNKNCLWSNATGLTPPSQTFSGWKTNGNVASSLGKGELKYMSIVLSGSAGGHYRAVINFANACTLTVEGDR